MRIKLLRGLICLVVLVFILAQATLGEIENPDGKVLSERWYAWNLNGIPSGYFHVLVIVPSDSNGEIAMRHDMKINARGKKMELHMLTLCRTDDYYSPRRLECEGTNDVVGDDSLYRFTAEIEPETSDVGSSSVLIAELGNKKKEIKLPEHVVTELALFEIIRRLPFEHGVVFEFNSLESTELNLKLNHTISYDGKENVMIDDVERSLHKFIQKGGGIAPCYYWVDDDHELIRIFMDDRKELMLTTEAGAKKNWDF